MVTSCGPKTGLMPPEIPRMRGAIFPVRHVFRFCAYASGEKNETPAAKTRTRRKARAKNTGKPERAPDSNMRGGVLHERSALRLSCPQLLRRGGRSDRTTPTRQRWKTIKSQKAPLRKSLSKPKPQFAFQAPRMISSPMTSLRIPFLSSCHCLQYKKIIICSSCTVKILLGIYPPPIYGIARVF